MGEGPTAKGTFGPDGRYRPEAKPGANRGGRPHSVAKGQGEAPLPANVRKRLGEKREDSRQIGVCAKCGEEVYALKDGRLRCWLFYGSVECIDGPHIIGRFYRSGPNQWLAKWGGGPSLPDWAVYYREQGQ